MRAARLEEENARLRKELEEAKHPKPSEPSEVAPVAPKPRTEAARLLAIGGPVAVIAAFGALWAILSETDVIGPRATAKTLEPSPSIAPPTTTSPTPSLDWIEDSHVSEADLRAVAHGVQPHVSYAVGAGGTILRRYTDTWTVEESGTTRDLRGVSEFLGRVCAVGDHGTATCALDPAKPAWKVEKTGTTEDLLALTQHYGFVAVGRHGTILRRNDDGSWSREDGGTKEDLFGVADEYIVGAHGTILHRENDRWHSVTSPTTADLYAIEKHSDDVVAVGAGGVIVRLGDPRAGFQVQPSGVTTDLFAVEHGGGYETYAAGAGGVVLISSGQTSAWRLQHVDTQRDLHTIDCSIPTMFIGGDHGTILSRRY